MSAYKDSKTGKWVVTLRYKDWQGNTQRKCKRGFATKREALAWEREFLTAKDGNIEMTFGSFTEMYLSDMKPRLKPDTYSMKKSIIEARILPYFKDVQLSTITPKMIVQWQNTLIELTDPETGERLYKKSYLKTIHNQISAILNYAVRYYGLPSNPARRAGNMGSEDEIKMSFWTTEEYERFSEVMMDKPVSYYAFEVLYWSGLRLGEMLALTPDDIDLKGKTISVSKTYYKLAGEEHITSPKTAKSNRTITIPDFLADELDDYMKSIPYLQHDDRIFSVSKGYIQAEMKRGCKISGVKKIRVHDLRHSHVSLLIHMGYSAVSIAQRTGHESIDITYRYAHMFPSVQNDMASQLNELRKGGDESEDK